MGEVPLLGAIDSYNSNVPWPSTEFSASSNPRPPKAGELVFSTFQESHQIGTFERNLWKQPLSCQIVSLHTSDAFVTLHLLLFGAGRFLLGLRLDEDPEVQCDVVTFTSAMGAVEWPWALELMRKMPQRGSRGSAERGDLLPFNLLVVTSGFVFTLCGLLFSCSSYLGSWAGE